MDISNNEISGRCKKLEEFRTSTGLSTESMCYILGISRSTMCRWKKGRSLGGSWQWPLTEAAIDKLNGANRRTKVYSRLVGKDQEDRVQALALALSE